MTTTTGQRSTEQSAEPERGGAGRRGTRLIRRLAGPVPGGHWLVVYGLFVIGFLYWHRYGKPWTGDALYYTAMTYQYAGHSLEESLRLTGQYFNDPDIGRLHYGFEDPVISPLIYPRVVYPALSVPFVMLIGGNGMYVVPTLSAIFVIWGLMRLLSRLFTTGIALAVTSVFVLTFAFQEFGVGLYTESPTLAFVVGVLLMLPLDGRRRFGLKEAVACSVLVVLVAFCRQSAPVLVAAVCGGWLWWMLRHRRVRGNPWHRPVAVLLPVGLAATLFLQWWAPYDAVDWFVRVNGEPDATTAFAHLPQIFWKLTLRDAAQYFVRDTAMLGIWAAGLIAVLVRPLSVRTGMLIGSLGPSILIATLNSKPSSFRYYVPMYPLLVLAAAGLLYHLLVRPSATAQPAPGPDDAEARPGQPSEHPVPA